MSPAGKATVIARLPDGPNPIAAIVPSAIRGGDNAGLYLTDTLSKNAYFAPASDPQPYAGDVIVGTELKGLFWAIKRSGGGYAATRIPTTLRGAHYNLEGMAYVTR